MNPKDSKKTSGVGDTEVSLTYLVVMEQQYIPALAIAGEVKIPTARNSAIGSKEFDYRIYGVASKRFGDVDLHFNLGYTFVGSPSGSSTKNPIDIELGADWFISPKIDLFAEITYVGSSIGNSSNEGDSQLGEGNFAPEVGGKEIVGSVGARYHFTDQFEIFGSFSYDNNNASLIRTGLSWKF